MKKVYVVTDGERILMACEDKSDAEDLVKLWGRDYAYSFIEVPYIVAKASAETPTYFPYEGTPKSPNGKPTTVNKGIEFAPIVTCNKKNDFLPKAPMDEVGMM